VKKVRSAHVSAKAPAAAPPAPVLAPPGRPQAGEPAPRGGLWWAWERFWFTPTDPVGLHTVRLLAGLLFLFWLLPFAGSEGAFFGLGGWFDQAAISQVWEKTAEAQRAGQPNPFPVIDRWSATYLAGADPTLLTALYWGGVATLVLFTLGVCTRLTAPLTWVVVASFTANPVLRYDGDALLQMLAFYLMVGYLLYGLWGAGRSRLERILGPADALLLGRRAGPEGARPSVAANLALRLLQVHFAVVVVVSGLDKLQFPDWWSGIALWFALYPPLQTTFEQARAWADSASLYLAILSLVAYLMIAWQLAFPMFAWRPRWRALLLGGGALAWLGSSWIYGMPLFGPAYFLGCLCFITPAEWRRALGRLPRLPGLKGLARWLPDEPARRRDAVPVTAGREP
jgi:hypothetical protein